MAVLEPTMAVSDFTKLPAEIIIDLINFDNGTSLPPDGLTFGVPTVLSEGTHNTTVVATAVADSYYEGSVTLTYNRIDLNEVPGIRSKQFVMGTAVNISDLIPQINEAYQLNLQLADFIDGPLPTLPLSGSNPEVAFELIAGPESLIFHNRVTLSAFRPNVALSSVITKTVLSGLVYRQPV